MSDKQGYHIRDQEACYFLTFQIVGWLDIFTRKRYRDIVVESFAYCQKVKGIETLSVILVNRLLKVYKTRIKVEENGCCINSTILHLNTSETRHTKFGCMKIIRLNCIVKCLNNA